MKYNKQIINSFMAASMTLLVGSVSTAHAAPGTLAQAPLFLQLPVLPNIFILHDNSGSMRWELMTDNHQNSGRLTLEDDNLSPALIHTPGCNIDDNNDGYSDIIRDDEVVGERPRRYDSVLQTNNEASARCSVVAEEEWRGRFNGYNKLYYNPERKYEPWVGTDNAGTAFANSSINAARINPFDASSATINLIQDSALLVQDSRTYYSQTSWGDWCSDQGLTVGADCIGWRYYTWNDSNNNNEIEEAELNMYWVKDLHPGTGDNPPINNQKNFANWFTYHRSREYAAKYALSVAISKADYTRVGYGTINDSLDNGIRIDEHSPSHVNNILTKLFSTSSNNRTPLRTKLQAVGEYYKSGNFFGEAGASPILTAAQGGACQANNAILMTDGFYNGASPEIGNVDGDNAAPYADIYSNTLADVAMEYYENDLSPSLPNGFKIKEKDYTPNIEDTATHQHMNTFTLAFGLTGTLDPDGTKTATESDTDILHADFSWPDPKTNTEDLIPERIDDLWHAAVNGRGSYLNAEDPDKLVEALVSTILGFTNQVQSATSITMSSFRLDDESKVFSTQFNPTDWSGKLLAHNVNTDGSVDTDTPAWDASELINDNANRTILTYNGSNGVAFTWGSDTCTNCISDSMRSDLIAGNTDDAGDPDQNAGQQRLNYLRGDEVDGFSFRERSSLLGDILSSTPLHVGTPASPYPDIDPFGDSTNRYYSFWNLYTNTSPRTPVLYVGANDGMLHGFNANTGEEVLAYVPEAVSPNLHKLTDPSFNDNHQNFVNHSPTAADAFFAQNGVGFGTKSWKTVLVGGLGSGGKAVYALDVTNPSSFYEANASDIVLWEFSAGDDIEATNPSDVSDIGYSFSQPVIGLMRNGRWAAITGNGYNSDSGVATLFIIYLDADPSDGWDYGTDYIKISTEVGGPADADKNGLSSPSVVDSNSDGYVDRAYAGDLEGNMWAFNLSAEDASTWSVAYTDSGDSSPMPLFKATNAASANQPITVKPSVIRHPYQPTITSANIGSNTSPNLMVLFGTGQYLTTGDISDTSTQSFYAVWDKGQALNQNDTGLTRNNLTEQTITSGTATNQTDVTARITTANEVPYHEINNTQRFGWFFDLDSASATTGERVVTNAVVLNNTVFFTTYVPNTTICGAGGTSWFMFVNAHDGGFPIKPVISINNDQLVNADDLVILEGDTAKAPSGLKIEGTLGSPSLDLGGLEDGDTGTALINTEAGIKNLATDLGDTSRGNRISWRELRRD